MQTWKILSYSGLIPFIICLGFSNYIDNLGLNSQQIFITYSAIILSFIAGSLWQVKAEEDLSEKQLISNFFSLTAFLSLCLDGYTGLVILTISYPLILCYEYSMFLQATQKSNYMKMRARLTLIVVIFHLLAFYLWC
jgi:hypothetical protein